LFGEDVYESSECEERGIEEDRGVRVESRGQEDGCNIEEEVDGECKKCIWFKE
jgi:hypothetical protein